MGISGLIPFLKGAMQPDNIRSFSGKTAAIDAYIFLHRGILGCCKQLALGEETDSYVTYVMKHVDLLIKNNVKPVVVLDGRNLPSKSVTEQLRKASRDINLELGKKLLMQGKESDASKYFAKCVDVTPDMAKKIVSVLRKRKIDYVVAPFEADAQMAFLALYGKVDLVITDDSDLIVYGCENVFFKLKLNGDGVWYQKSKLCTALGINVNRFSFQRFQYMAILSGCDYQHSLRGIGLARAKVIAFASVGSVDIQKMLQSIPYLVPSLQSYGNEDYLTNFTRAANTFLYQLVFDTEERKLRPLHPYPDGRNHSDFTFAGEHYDSITATNFALGNCNYDTMRVVDNFEPMKEGYPRGSIWWKNDSLLEASSSLSELDIDMTSPLPAGQPFVYSTLGEIEEILTQNLEFEDKNKNLAEHNAEPPNVVQSIDRIPETPIYTVENSSPAVRHQLPQKVKPAWVQKFRGQGLLKSARIRKNYRSLRDILRNVRTLY